MLINALAGLTLFAIVTGSPLRAELMCLPILAPGGVTPNVNDTCPADHNGTNPIGTLVLAGGGPHGVTLRTPGPGLAILATRFEDVYEEPGGTLDFYLQLKVANTNLPPSITDVAIGPFTNAITEVGTVSPIGVMFSGGPGTIAPSYETRSPDGSQIDFHFPNGIPSGTTFALAISTNATQYDLGGGVGFTDIYGLGGVPAVGAFVPVASTPEPAAILLLGCALGLSAAIIRRRRS